MVGGRLVDSIGMKEELIKKACSCSLKAHGGKKLFRCKEIGGSSEVVFSFPGSWSKEDWFCNRAFGYTKADLSLFPSLRSLGNDEVAMVNGAFFRRFEEVLKENSFKKEVFLQIYSFYFLLTHSSIQII